MPGDFSGLAYLLEIIEINLVMYFQHTGNSLGYSYKFVNSVQ